MKEHPIIFSGPMVKAILEGRKTQTRRIYRPLRPGPYEIVEDGKVWEMDECGDYIERIGPYGTIGDRLWVREVFQYTSDKWVMYAADSEMRSPQGAIKGCLYQGPWKSPIYMPRWASRITLEITDIRVQGLQEISEEDAKAEGVEWLFSDEEIMRMPEYGVGERHYKNYMWHGDFGKYGTGNELSDTWPYQYSGYKNARGSFSSLWHKINAKHAPWESNPWVFAISFKRIVEV